ncbi:MAG: hypothetical protein KC561_15740, partial [Myxococcales bacterium]|nr:hypothetical protein [Myxococcales bacterium]
MRHTTFVASCFVAITLFGLGSPAFADGAPILYLGTELFELRSDGIEPQRAPAIETRSTAAQFYNYCSASSHTGFELAGRSLIFLHRNVTQPNPSLPGYTGGTINLVVTHGIDADQ